MKKTLKQTLKHLFSFPVNAIASACFVAWVFGVFSCVAADFNDQSLEYNDDPIKIDHYYPPVAQGYEEIYDRFLNGKLIYRPNPGSDEGKIELRIADLDNPLEGTFDLSRCGYTGNYLSISTGYRKRKKPENEDKIEVWFVPRFLIERELKTTAKHFEPIYGNWKEQGEIGIFWTGGRWDSLAYYDYLTTQNMGDLSKNNLFEKWGAASFRSRGRWGSGGGFCEKFHVHFCRVTTPQLLGR